MSTITKCLRRPRSCAPWTLQLFDSLLPSPRSGIAGAGAQPLPAGGILGLLFLLLSGLFAQVQGQATNRISQLTGTNVIAGSNLVVVVTNPTATNGTKAVRVDNLFSNATHYGWITNGGTFSAAATWSTNSGSTVTQTLATVNVPANSGILLTARAAYYEVDTPAWVTTVQAAGWYNYSGFPVLTTLTTNHNYASGANAGLIWATNNVTNVVLRAYGVNSIRWRVGLEGVFTP